MVLINTALEIIINNVKALREMELALIVALLISALLSVVSLRRRYLKRRGAAMAFVMGSATALVDVRLFLLLIAFFLSSSALTKVRGGYKASIGLKDVEGRSLGQVVGVGAPILAFTVLAAYDARAYVAVITAIASANSDTWASELGVAFGGRPRMIFRPWARVVPGTSGAVTSVGLLGGALGSAFIGVIAAVLGLLTTFQLFVVSVLGFAGNLLDTLLGATVQIRYICKDGTIRDDGNCEVSEVKGSRHVDNETVNLISESVVGIAALAVLVR